MADIAEIVRHRRSSRPWRDVSAVAVVWLPAIAFCVLLVVGWDVASRTTASPLVPSAWEVGEEIVRLLRGGDAFRQIGVTLTRIVLGFAAAFVISLVCGIAAARSAAFRRFCEPALLLGLTVPGLVWSLLCVIWFGVGVLAPTVAIALGIVPVMMLHVIQGMRSVDNDLVEMVSIFQLSKRDRLALLWMPALVPHLIAGARVGLSLAWKVIVLVELFGLSNGVGYQLNAEFSSQNVAGVLAWTVIFWAVMVGIEYGLLQLLERRLLLWRREADV